MVMDGRVFGTKIVQDDAWEGLKRGVLVTRAFYSAVSKRTVQGADPGLDVGGGANLLGGGADPIYLIYFMKNPMKLKIFWSVGGRAGSAPPLRSATAVV